MLEHGATVALAAHTERREYWDPDRVAGDIARALEDLARAARVGGGDDGAVTRAIARLQRLQVWALRLGRCVWGLWGSLCFCGCRAGGLGHGRDCFCLVTPTQAA